MKRTITLGPISVITLVAAAAALDVGKTKSEQAFDRLASLQGEWEGEAFGGKTKLFYTVTADGFDGRVPAGDRPKYDYDVHRRWRSSNCHPLLLGEKSATNGDVGHYRCAENAGFFPCSGHWIEIA
jgi:hypothetical protein